MNWLYIFIVIYVLIALWQLWSVNKRLKNYESYLKQLATQTHQVATSQLNQAVLIEHLSKSLDEEKGEQPKGE